MFKDWATREPVGRVTSRSLLRFCHCHHRGGVGFGGCVCVCVCACVYRACMFSFSVCWGLCVYTCVCLFYSIYVFVCMRMLCIVHCVCLPICVCACMSFHASGYTNVKMFMHLLANASTYIACAWCVGACMPVWCLHGLVFVCVSECLCVCVCV